MNRSWGIWLVDFSTLSFRHSLSFLNLHGLSFLTYSNNIHSSSCISYVLSGCYLIKDKSIQGNAKLFDLFLMH